MIETFGCVVIALMAFAIGALLGMWVTWPENEREFLRGYDKGKENRCKDCDAYKQWICEKARQTDESVRDIVLAVNVVGMEKAEKEKIENQLEKLKKKINRGFGVT